MLKHIKTWGELKAMLEQAGVRDDDLIAVDPGPDSYAAKPILAAIASMEAGAVVLGLGEEPDDRPPGNA